MWSSIKSAFNSVTGQQGTNADCADQHIDPTSNETVTSTHTRKTGILPLGLASLYSHRSSNAEEDEKENTRDQIISLAFDAESFNAFDNGAFVKKFSLETVAKIKDAHQEERIWNVEWHPNGEMFATCGGDKTIRVWRRRRFANANVDKDKIDDDDAAAVAGDAKQNSDVVSFFQTCEAVEHRRTVRRVAWSPCGKFLAAASFDNVVSVWRLFECAPTTSSTSPQTSSKNEIQYSLLSLELESMLEGHENEVKACVFDPLEGRILATCSRDRSVWVWEKLDPNNNQQQEDPDALVEFETLAVLGGHSQDVKSVTFAPTLLRHSSHFNTADASFDPVNPRQLDIVSSSYDDTIKIWRNISRTAEDDWHCVQTIAKHQGTVWESRFQPQGIYSPSSMFSETNHNNNNNNNFEAADFEKLSCVSDNNSFPAFASCGHDGRVFLFRLALPSAADMKNSKLTKQQQTNIGRISKYECVGSLGDFHDGGAAIVALDWLPPVPTPTSSSSTLALNFLSRSSLILSCGTDDKICLLDCPMLRRKPALIFNCDFLAEEKHAANNNFEGSGHGTNSNSDLICVEKFASPHSLEMNCVRVASRWESLEFGEEEMHNNDDDDDKSMTKRKFVKKAAVLVVTVADDGDICVSRLKLEF